MPTTVRDASLVTIRNRNKAEASYYNAWKSNTVTSATPLVNLKSPVIGGANLLSEVSNGLVETNTFNNEYAKYASTNGVALATIQSTLKTLGPDPNVSLYPFNASTNKGNQF